VKLQVPFFANTNDDLHCFEAAFKMVLKHFEPEKDYSWEELEKVTGKVDGKWTWPISAILWFVQRGYQLKDIEIFDYKKFSLKGEEYLIEFFGEEVGREQIENSNLIQERQLAGKLAEHNLVDLRLPSTDDIKGLLADEYLIVCNVNSMALNKKLGYVGHAVVVTGFDSSSLIIHDPGLPPFSDRVVSYSDFEKAWAYPTEVAKNLLAIKK
jgi:hypothetical protein